MHDSYEAGITDEFVKPVVITDNNNSPVATMLPGDVVLCFNFRTDRCRQITRVLTQEDMPGKGMNTLPLHYVTMTSYDDTFRDVHIIFNKDNITDTLGEVISGHGLTQLRIAETEKYPHVTYFFSGGRETIFPGEDRAMIASPKVSTYDHQPEMSAFLVRDIVLEKIQQDQPDFICLNFANTDMVGHTGVFAAGIKAAETVDQCVEAVVKCALDHDYTLFITADHGNADMMINPDGTPNTAHTKNLVPLFFVDKTWQGKLKSGKLGDLAPSILTIMQLPIPAAMTGEILIPKA
jgi:2,3-bisphosphoglycerate-independent phosphoglycerate mutase